MWEMLAAEDCWIVGGEQKGLYEADVSVLIQCLSNVSQGGY